MACVGLGVLGGAGLSTSWVVAAGWRRFAAGRVGFASLRIGEFLVWRVWAVGCWGLLGRPLVGGFRRDGFAAGRLGFCLASLRIGRVSVWLVSNFGCWRAEGSFRGWFRRVWGRFAVEGGGYRLASHRRGPCRKVRGVVEPLVRGLLRGGRGRFAVERVGFCLASLRWAISGSPFRGWLRLPDRGASLLESVGVACFVTVLPASGASEASLAWLKHSAGRGRFADGVLAFGSLGFGARSAASKTIGAT